MTRLILFLLVFVGAGWLLVYSFSGRNQKRAVIGIGKVLLLVVLGALVVAGLTIF